MNSGPSKSGNPCDRFTAPCWFASAVISAKMVVPYGRNRAATRDMGEGYSDRVPGTRLRPFQAEREQRPKRLRVRRAQSTPGAQRDAERQVRAVHSECSSVPNGRMTVDRAPHILSRIRVTQPRLTRREARNPCAIDRVE